MKKLTGILAVAAFVLGIAPRTFAATPETNLDKAIAYEQKATELDTVVKDHEAMKKAGMTDKTPVTVRQKMEKHCDAIITDAAKLRDDYKAFATWYRLQATEQKGK